MFKGVNFVHFLCTKNIFLNSNFKLVYDYAMKAGSSNKVTINRQMLREARLACNRYKLSLAKKRSHQEEQEKRRSFKRKLEAEAQAVKRNLARFTADNNSVALVSAERLREIDTQLAKS